MKSQKTIIQIKPTFLRKAEAIKYVGVEETLFREMIKEFKPKVYRRGKNVVWYEVTELDNMIREHLLTA